MNRLLTGCSFFLPAALCAERIGRDDLAEFFAEKGEEFHLQVGLAASCRAIRARVAQRRGDRARAVQLWQSAASDVMENSQPAYAVRFGQDCGGEEGETMLSEGLAAIGVGRAESEAGFSGLMAPPDI